MGRMESRPGMGARCVRNTVDVMLNRKNTRIVAEAEFRQDIQRPGGAARDREAGRAIAVDGNSGGVLNAILGARRIFAEFVAASICRSGDASTSGRPAHDHVRAISRNKVGIALRHPAQNEERTFDLGFVEQIENTLRVAFDAALEAWPSASVDDSGEGFHVEIIFDVDGNDTARAHDELSNKQLLI